MAEIKFTKNALRDQQTKLNQLQKYLPTLQLKKALLQQEIQEARQEIIQLEETFEALEKEAKLYGSLLKERTIIDPSKVSEIKEFRHHTENIAGVEVPFFDSVEFEELKYSLVDTPAWIDAVIEGLRSLTEAWLKVKIAREKKAALEYELRQVSIRVNLFEKVLIPRALANIKKIKVFLGDQLLAAVGQVKVAKTKIEERKQASEQRKNANLINQ